MVANRFPDTTIFTPTGHISFRDRTLSFRSASSAWLNLRELAHVAGGGEARPALGVDRLSDQAATRIYPEALIHALAQLALVDAPTRNKLFANLLDFIEAFQSFEGLVPLFLTGYNNAAVSGSFDLTSRGRDLWNKYWETADRPIDMNGFPYFDCENDSIYFLPYEELRQVNAAIGKNGAASGFSLTPVISGVAVE